MSEAADYSAIVNSILDHRNGQISTSIIYQTESTTIHTVAGEPPLAVRVSVAPSPDHSLRLQILDDIGSLGGVIATALHSETREIGGETHTIDVMPYLDGAALTHSPSAEEVHAITQVTSALHHGLKASTPSFADASIPKLCEVLHGLLSAAAPGKMKSRAEQLLTNDQFMQLVTSDDQCLVYGDPWPSNFLLVDDGVSTLARIVDVDPILLAPPVLQPALLFSACFVVAAVLFDDSVARPDLDAFIQAWPDDLDRTEMVLMMKVYPIMLSLVKLAEATAGVGGCTKQLDANLRLLIRCLEMVDSYE